MEFDLEAFTTDVAAALRYTSPLSQKRGGYGWSGDESENAPAGSVRGEVGDGSKSAKRICIESGREIDGAEGERRGMGIGNDCAFENESEEIEMDDDGFEELQAFLDPSLDMTTALISTQPRIPPPLPTHDSQFYSTVDSSLMSRERLDLVPNFYSYTINACLLPIRKIQHDLVTLYFNHIHPMFPVVDEYRVTELHRKFRGREELMDAADFIVYHAIMVAGFAHLSEAQVRLTPYRSVLVGQEAQVDQLKALYWSQSTADPTALTQVCLLLSLWSPGWIGSQNNSYWLDMAFKHATTAKLWESRIQTPNRKCRRRLLWWCCLIRDRVLALGMRRPHRLHRQRHQEAIISEDDFGLEARFPSYTDIGSKKVAMFSFIWFCKLSKIMEAIAEAQGRNRFSKDWNGENVGNLAAELEELSGFEKELMVWIGKFEGAVEGVLKNEHDEMVPVSVSTLRIIAHSLCAGLYQPYLHLPIDNPALAEADIDPLARMKEGARQVAISVRNVMSSKKSDAIPTWLVSWVTLPVAVYHVNQRIRHNSTPDEVLMPFLAQLIRRSSGALMLLMTVRSATKDYIEKIGDKEPVEREGGLQFVHSRFSRIETERSTEARLLASVTRQVDVALELNGSVGDA